MAKALVIVESPAKAKTINKFLGSGYTVEASMGHVRDLPEKDIGVDIQKDFTPEYVIISDRKKVVAKLKKDASKADKVFLATDLDREGEAIAWHLVHALNVPDEKALRVTFNEITKSAIQAAFHKPGKIDLDKVNAQQARRILDRIVGYKISPLLWKKITKGLSAGRVQSVAVRLIVEREKEIRAFKTEEYWKITAHLRPHGKTETFEALLVQLDSKEFKASKGEEAQAAVADLEKAPYVVAQVEKEEKSSKPPPPFKTSTLQQQASTRLRFSASRTMRLAQQLYEGVDIGPEGPVGLITYMRTDSVHIAQRALDECRQLIPAQFGPKYLPEKPNRYASGKGAQEAHEAIRPTSVERTPESVQQYLTEEQFKLYQMIWQRFVASQMKPALYEVTTVQVQAGRGLFQAKGRRVLFDGHTVISGVEKAEDEQMLPALEPKQPLDLLKLEPTQHFTKPPPRYTEASLVRTMERLGIGRPSTYAPIIETIQQRGYVNQVERQFHATDLGIVVTDKLVQHFPQVLDVQFTSQMESELDKIEEAHADWLTILRNFYGPFKDALDKAGAEMTTVKEVTDEVCDKCGKPMAVRYSKHGKFLGCTGYPECKNLKPLADQTPMADEKCEKCGAPMVFKIWRKRRYVACTAYPTCKNMRQPGRPGSSEPKEPPKETGEKCEKCGKPLVIRTGRRGPFIACSGFPKCRNAKPLPKPEPQPASPSDNV